MGSYRSGRGGRSPSNRFRERRPGGGGSSGGDFRWKKDKKRKRDDSISFAASGGAEFHESGDFLDDNDFDAPPGAPSEPGDRSQQTAKTEKEKKAAIRKRQRSAKRRRREMHEVERETSDAMIHSAPERLLWKSYLAWAGDKLSSVEKKVEQWTKEQVLSAEERPDMTLIQQVKKLVGADYAAQGDWKKKSTALPGIACIALAFSAVRAVHLAKSIYDGRPVGKLFSKHIKIEVQKEWLSGCCAKGLAPSAAGTAKRVQRLIEEGNMTLKHTVALVIDFRRNAGNRNILDLDTTRDELFEFLHTHARPLIAEGKMKVILYAPKQEEGVAKDEPVLEAS